MYEASEYTPDYGARERALQLLADVKKREEGSKVVRLDKRTLVVRNEKRMDEDLLPHTILLEYHGKGLDRGVKDAVMIADALIAELKKGGEK